MPEGRRDNVTGGSVGQAALGTHAGRRQPLQFLECHADGTVMGVHDTAVITDECCDGDRFGWREGEIVEYPTVGHSTRLSVIIDLAPGGFEPLREEFAGARVQVVTEV